MAETPDYIDIEEVSGKPRGRRGDGGTYMIVADETDEFTVALRYAARLARSNRAHVGVLYVIDIEDFQHWNKIEDKMRRELREKAEKFIWNVAKKVNDLNGLRPALYIREGNKIDEIIKVIDEDDSIRSLILGGVTQSKGPGALVAHFTGRGLSRLRVPVIVVPGHLEPQKIDEIV